MPQQLREGPGADANILVQSATLIPTAAILAARGDAEGARAMIARVPDREHASDVQDRGMWVAGVAYVEAHLGNPRRAIELGRLIIRPLRAAGIRPSGHQGRSARMRRRRDRHGRPGDAGDDARVDRRQSAGPPAADRSRRCSPSLTAVLDRTRRDSWQPRTTYRALGYKPWLASCLEQHADVLEAAGRHADAEPVMDEARQIYTELAMAPALERVGGGEALPRGA